VSSPELEIAVVAAPTALGGEAFDGVVCNLEEPDELIDTHGLKR
jgi:hypothetical protein